MTLQRKLALSGAILCSLMFSAPMTWADALNDIKAAKVLKVAVPQDFAPFGSAGPDLKPIGYDIDMANLIGKELGVSVEIVPVTSANRIPYLQTKKVDLVISSLGKNAEREKAIDFSVAYAPFFSGVYGLKSVKVSKLDELANQTVGATRGTIEEQELSSTAPSSLTLKRYEDNNATIAAYVSGQIDLVATGNTIAAILIEKAGARAPELKFVVKNSPCYIGLNKEEPALLPKVDEIIAKVKASGELNALSQKWMKAPLPADF